MRSDGGEALRAFVASRFPQLRRSAFLMCGDWARADELARTTLARLITDGRRGNVEDADAYAWSEVMHAFQHRSGRREHVFVAAPEAEGEDPETILVLDALHRLTPRCRAVLILRQSDGFTVDETADLLGLPDERVEACEKAGLGALEVLLAGVVPAGAGLLECAFAHEPPVGDAVEDIFRRAEAARGRRVRAALTAAAGAVVLVASLGYALTTVLLPTTPTRSAAAERLATRAPADPVAAILTPVLKASGLRIVAREPARGAGWRRYLVLASNGRPHGLVEVSAYAAPDGLCFPVLADPDACARPERAAANVEYVRYADDRDVDWQVNETIARLSDGRVVVVQATGERGTGSAPWGRPPLTALLTAKIAADPRMAGAFGASERCHRPDPACPILKVPVPIVD